MIDVVVIGAGPAGSVASAYLTQKGLKVLVLEKMSFPRFVIGESLLPHCMDHLQEVGLLDRIMNKQNFQKKIGANFYRNGKYCFFSFNNQYTKGWEWTWQVQREQFDEMLISEVQKMGALVQFNSEITNVKCSENEQTIIYNKNNENKVVKARFVIDSSGYGRVLPRLFQLEKPSTLENRGAIFTHVYEDKREKSAGDNIVIYSFNNNKSWIWTIPFSDGTTSVGIVGQRNDVENLAKDNGALFENIIRTMPELKNRFTNSKFKFDPRAILSYSVGVKQLYGKGYVLCGNSTEFLDPVFSSGVTLATVSGLKAAKCVEKHLKNEQIDWKTEYSDYIEFGVDVFKSFVNGWYDGTLQNIFFTENVNEEFKKQICSVLAGYVWDKSNPFIKKHKTILKTLSSVLEIN